jgi:hypothetical protein
VFGTAFALRASALDKAINSKRVINYKYKNKRL